MQHVRRIVTGVNDAGKSCVVQDGPSPGLLDFGSFVIQEQWKVNGLPVEPNAPGDPADVDRYFLEPPAGGAKFCFFTIQPDDGSTEMSDEKLALIQEKYVGLEAHDDPDDVSWHRTETLDFIILMSGEMILDLDEGEVHLSPGDVVIQRGTRHAWRNPGNVPATGASIMLSARPASDE
ncbi:MAG: cupin domain-containing protein [Thermomicrobiales bacterium]